MQKALEITNIFCVKMHYQIGTVNYIGIGIKSFQKDVKKEKKIQNLYIEIGGEKIKVECTHTDTI